MPRYFFDIRDHVLIHDDEGTELPSPDAAAQHAQKILPGIAAHEAPMDGERYAFTALVRDEEGHPIYSAALSYVGTWLTR